MFRQYCCPSCWTALYSAVVPAGHTDTVTSIGRLTATPARYVGGGLDVLPVGHPPRRDPRPYDGTRPDLFGMNRQPNVPGACLSNRSPPPPGSPGGAGRQHGDLGRLPRSAEVWSSLPYMMGPIFSLSGAGDF